MTLDIKTVTWLLVAGAADTNDLHDIQLALFSLSKCGVPTAKIQIFIDPPQGYTQPLLAAQHPLLGQSKPVADLATYAVATAELVMVVFGHGAIHGIPDAGGSYLAPCELMSIIRKLGVKHESALVVLGQCFAGTFNFIDTDEKIQVVVIGATSLNPSLAMSFMLGSYKLPWASNAFLAFFFSWLLQPHDLDGDGKTSVMDAFKYAGIRTNEVLRTTKSSLFQDCLSRAEQLRSVRAMPPPSNPADLVAHEARVDAIATLLNQDLELLYLHQEPFILNARLAQRMELQAGAVAAAAALQPAPQQQQQQSP